MQTTNTLTKQIPTSEGTIFEISGIPASGLVVVIDNLDASNSITYKFQDSNDGVTWTDREFAPCGGGSPATTFAVPPNQQHVIKLSPDMSRLRLRASAGAGVLAQLTLTRATASSIAANSPIFLIA